MRLEDGDILEQEKHSCFSHRHAASKEAQPSGHSGESTRSIERGFSEEAELEPYDWKKEKSCVRRKGDTSL